MSLPNGTLLGSYQIGAQLGVGGMGEVYRARDTKLARDVAIKVLPEAVADDPDRLARFQREAQMLAALNHPNIAAIYGLEEQGPAKFLVLELISGESLAQKLEGIRGSGLGISESLGVAHQIIDALEAAHDKGIIHRDLKPANIMLTDEGHVKVLDFGLAKLEPVGSGEAGGPGGLTHSPTLTFAATQAGVILGTAAYMSPEQAKGRLADKRSDVWAFGCVLFEMLTGKRAFEGEDVSDTLAAILRGEPDWSALPADVPTSVRTIVTRCLQKDRKLRIPDVSVVRFLMDDATAAGPAPVEAGSKKSDSAPSWKLTSALLALAVLVTAAAAWWSLSRPVAAPIARFFVYPPDKHVFASSTGAFGSGIISPDGNRLAFTARDADGKVLVWVRPIDALVAQPLAGTEGAVNPFWSPDSRFLAYFAPGKLMKVPVAGGPPLTLASRVTGNRGGSWSRDDVIVVNAGPGVPLQRVSASGGEFTAAMRLMPGQTSHVFPLFLPDGRHLLFYVYGSNDDTTGIYVGSIDSGDSTRLTGADSGAVFVADQLLFVRQGTLMAQPFNATTLTLSGDPLPIAERVESSGVPGFVSFSVSTTGVLAYGVGSGRTGGLQTFLVDRTGKAIATGPVANYRGIELSPDGRSFVAHRHEGSGGDLWITDLVRGATSRLTFDAAQDNASPIWSPDGSQIAFGSMRNGKWGLYRKASNNSGAEERLFESSGALLPQSWSPDGQTIVYVEIAARSSDLWLLRLPTAGSSDTKSVPLERSPFTESHAQISPDGKWLAYTSTETGRGEVYVRQFPAMSGKWSISTGGGVYPRWRRDGRELFYLDQASNGRMIAVDVNGTGPGFTVGPPRVLFDTQYINLGHTGPYHPYAVSADGQQFVIPRSERPSAEAVAPIAVVLNWQQVLKK